ncbi:MAG: hypothetical protein JNM70_06240 [Anaerolineae bacterium]|nr:hypothetical protein [Anaerolineae bacterium]
MVSPKRFFSELDKRLASYLMPLQPGTQLLSARDLAEQFGVSLGSVSTTLNLIEEMGAITLNRRGRLGSFLESKSIGKLWSIVASRPMVIALTLPSYPKGEGLATAIYSLLNNAGVETYLIFIRGSFNRINALKTGLCHAVVVSALTADSLDLPETKAILRLPPQTFVTDHRVFFRNQQPPEGRPLVVGIDYDSFDVKYITELEFADREVEFQQIPYTLSDLNLERSSVDAAISDADHLERLHSKEATSRPLSPKVQALLGGRDTIAVMLVNAHDVATQVVLTDILRPDAIQEIQENVVSGRAVPRY